MVRIISALILAVFMTGSFAQENSPLVDNPPARHVVVPGDTLWGIAKKFLKEPWRWPEIWQFNKEQIKNPHRIYPGDVVVLDRSGAKPRLKIASPNQLKPQVYSEAIKKEISSIPSSVIEPFIAKPMIVSAEALDSVPRIIAGQEDRTFLGNDDVAFVSGIPDTRIVDWNVFRPGKPLKDPDSEEILGYEAYDVGSARLVQPGTPAIVKIMTAREEIGRGERLTPAPKKDIVAYVPRAPEKQLSGKVMSMYGALSEGGPLSVITLNRGTRDGVEVGHVLALQRHRSAVGYDDDNKRVTTPLPDERYGLVFVFRAFDRVSYALVMEASRSVIVGDIVKNP